MEQINALSARKAWYPRNKIPNILILSASVGAGHVRAGDAIRKALEERMPDAMVTHIDVLKLTNSAFRKLYSEGYFKLVKHSPHLTSLLYDKLDCPEMGTGISPLSTVERANLHRLIRLLTKENWDLVINTHFLPPKLIARLRRNNRVTFPQATVITDFDVHGMWINSPCEAYFVATTEARAYMISLGIDPNHVYVTGIPIDSVFTKQKDRDTCRHKHGFSTGRPLILQMAGAFGVGAIEQIFTSLQSISIPIQICVVTGKNEKAKGQLDSLSAHSRHPCRILGFTHEIDEFMIASDAVVTKPGGLTTSETLACGRPMLIVEPIPGQEERNSDFLLENGCAIKVNNFETLGYKLETLLGDIVRLQNMKDAARRCGRPEAAQNVAEYCLRLLDLPKQERFHLAKELEPA